MDIKAIEKEKGWKHIYTRPPRNFKDALHLFIYEEDNKKGIVTGDGGIVFFPIFDSIIKDIDGVALCKMPRRSDLFIRVLLGTYGEGLICAEIVDYPTGKTVQFFVDNTCNYVLKLNNYFHVPYYSEDYFIKGCLIVYIPIDYTWVQVFKVDRKGNVELLREEAPCLKSHSDEDPHWYSSWRSAHKGLESYGEEGYWNIPDEGLRDGLDDDVEAYWNID